MKKLMAVVAVTSVIAGTSWAGSTVLFEDNFDDEPVTGANQTPEDWIVAGGTVDIIGEGTSWDLFPGQGYGLYIDLTGSDGPAGLLALRDPVLFETDCTYTLSFDLAGSQRLADQLIETVGIGFADVPGLYLGVFTRNWDEGFGTETVAFAGDGLSHMIIFYNLYSADGIGALLDNVVLTGECRDDACSVPAPDAVLLGGLGASLMGFFRRRHALKPIW